MITDRGWRGYSPHVDAVSQPKAGPGRRTLQHRANEPDGHPRLHAVRQQRGVRSLSDDEAIALVRVYRQCIAPGKTLIVGAGRESAYTTAEFVLHAADAGADYVSVVTPHYFPKMRRTPRSAPFTRMWPTAHPSRFCSTACRATRMAW